MSNQNANHAQDKSKFEVFLSHKVKEKGEAAEKMKTWLEGYAPEKLDVFVSPAIEAAKRWNAEVFKKLSEADLLILLYTDPSADMDWCLFETGFFAGVSQMKPDRGLMCLLPQGLSAPKPLEDWENVEATDDGIKKMLRAIYENKKKPVRLDLFDDNNKELLAHLIELIKKVVGPGPEELEKTPRMWITIKGDDLLALKKGGIPNNAVLEDNKRALSKFGLDMDVSQAVTWDSFAKAVKCKQAMPFLTFHLADTMATGLSLRGGIWTIPAIRLNPERDKHTWSLMLTKILAWGITQEQFDNGNVSNDAKVKFEFSLAPVWTSYGTPTEDPMEIVYHLITVAWHCKWRVTTKHLRSLKSLASSQSSEKEINEALKTVQKDIQCVLLDCLNRGLMYPSLAEKPFRDTEDFEKIKSIVTQDTGKWAQTWKQLLLAISEGNIQQVIELLKDIETLADNVFRMASNRLYELANMDSNSAKNNI